jgi:hypothetical protein
MTFDHGVVFPSSASAFASCWLLLGMHSLSPGCLGNCVTKQGVTLFPLELKE